MFCLDKALYLICLGEVVLSGEPVNTHTGESLHKEVKSFARTCKGGGNIPHTARRRNARMAAEWMLDGLRWDARAYDRKRLVSSRLGHEDHRGGSGPKNTFEVFGRGPIKRQDAWNRKTTECG